jgi:hypothetical protein
MKKKLVLVWVDNTGFELTGRYRDRLGYYPETKCVPEARAACFGDDTPAMRERLQAHIAKECQGHVWVGFFSLDYKDDILKVARAKALELAR